MPKKHILIVGYQDFNQQMYPHTYDVIKLLQKQFIVDIFTTDRGEYLERIQWADGNPISFIHQIYQTYKHTLKILFELRKIIAKKNYNTVLAIDHAALFYCRMLPKINFQLIFWSHDIVTHDHIWYLKSLLIRILVRDNHKYLRIIDRIIIQDHNRGAVLDETIGSHYIKKFYLPVSLYSDNSSINTSKLKNLKKDFKEINLFQIGSIHKERLSIDLINMVSKLNNKLHLSFMGYIDKDIIRSNSHNKNVTFHNFYDSYDKMREMLSTCDIGLVGLNHPNLNNHFYSKASGQLVEFLRLGIPIISFYSDELGDFINANSCGIHIANLSMLDKAIKTILPNYSHFSKMASVTYSDYFDLQKYERGLFDIMNQNEH